MPLAPIEQAIEDIKTGKFVIIVDDEDRENEGDLAIAGEFVSPETINFMSKFGRGLICMPMTSPRLDELDLPLMVAQNTARHGTGFTVSVDAVSGSTGISAQDRALTVQVLLNTKTMPKDLARPGHMFPLRYQEGGVLVRAGQTEGIIDLAKLAGLKPAGLICEIMSEDGTMARMPQLEEFSAKFGINIVSVAQIISFRLQNEKLVERVADARLPTSYGEFRAVAYRSGVDDIGHVATAKRKIS